MADHEYEAMLRSVEFRAHSNSVDQKNDLIARLKEYESYLKTQIQEKKRWGGEGQLQRSCVQSSVIAYEDAIDGLYEVFPEIDPEKK